MKKLIPFALLAGAALIAVPVLADPGDGPDGGHHRHHGGMATRMFETFDLNKDGKVTKDEVAEAETQRFAKLSGGAATISKAQFVDFEAGRAREHAERKFQHLDKNGDGKLERAEFERPHGGMFDHLDKNHDGVITKDEIPARGPHPHDGEGRPD